MSIENAAGRGPGGVYTARATLRQDRDALDAQIQVAEAALKSPRAPVRRAAQVTLTELRARRQQLEAVITKFNTRAGDAKL
jgi:hypothetical protein